MAEARRRQERGTDSTGAGPVLLFGVDAGSPAIVRALAAAGHLPNFARLLAHGRCATVEHEPGLFVGSIWPTALTGVGVGRHGFYTGIRPAPFSYGYVPAGVEAEPFWVDVAQHGSRIAVIDAPFFEARAGLDGAQLVEWGCHDRYHGTHSAPPELLDDVLRHVGPHPIGMIDNEIPRFAPCDKVHAGSGLRSGDDVAAFADVVQQALHQRRRLVKYLDDRDSADRDPSGPSFDLVVHIVAETHCAGHHLWHVHDPSHPRHDPALRARVGDPFVEVYRAVDDLLGDHLRILGDHGTAYVLLSHGMRAHADGTLVLDELLWRLDQRYRGVDVPWLGRRTARLAALVDRFPSTARSQAARAVGRVAPRTLGRRPMEATPASDVPAPGERLWYQLENNNVTGAVRFNRVGREPHGLVGPGMVDHARAWLTDELHRLVDVDTGRPAVTEVRWSADLYDRDPTDGLPDMLVEWDIRARLDRVWSPTVGLVCRPYAGNRTGDHDGVGELIVVGRGIRPGRRPTIRGLDVAPTVAAAAGTFLRDRDAAPLADLVPSGAAAPGWTAAIAGLGSAPPRRRSPGAVSSRDVEPAAVRRELIELRREVDGLLAAHHETRLAAVEGQCTATLAVDAAATTSWIAAAGVETTTMISVVIPTRNRVSLAQRAVRSVLRQTYPTFELLVVDDASDDGTSDWLATVEDPRLRVIHQAHCVGAGAARNAALDSATGDVVAFLDDDNTFDPNWLRSVAWMFATHPDVHVTYGIRVVDDTLRHLGGGPPMPWLQLNAWDRATNLRRNLVDINVLAHRRSHVRFDPELPVMPDWDYLIALTVDTDPLPLPVLAAYYTTDGPERATLVHADREDEVYERIRRRWTGS